MHRHSQPGYVDHNRKRARQITALVVGLVVAACTIVIVTDASAAPYITVAQCKSSLRGGGGSDNDVHNKGWQTRAAGFVGWSTHVTRLSRTNVYVRGLLTYRGGRFQWFTGHCWSRPYGPDSFG